MSLANAIRRRDLWNNPLVLGGETYSRWQVDPAVSPLAYTEGTHGVVNERCCLWKDFWPFFGCGVRSYSGAKRYSPVRTVSSEFNRRAAAADQHLGSSACPLLADFVAEVGDQRSEAAEALS